MLNVIGLKNTEDKGIDLARKIYKKYFDRELSKASVELILDNMCDDNNKTVDELLHKFIGVHKLDISIKPPWFKEFIKMIYDFSVNLASNNRSLNTRNRAKSNHYLVFKQELFTEETIEDGKIHNYLPCEVYNEIRHINGYIKKNINLENGTIKDKHNRDIKIMKFLKSTFTKLIDKECNFVFEDTNFYKFYIKNNNATNKQLYLVITNSVASIMGMSCYAPEYTNGNRMWSSCQQPWQYTDSHSKCIFPNIADKGSLIMYVTDGEYIEYQDDNNYPHYQMYARWVLRLLKDANGDSYIALDRAYPNARYTPYVFPILYKLCKLNKCLLSIHSEYNHGQGDVGDDGQDYEHSYYLTEEWNALNNGCKTAEQYKDMNIKTYSSHYINAIESNNSYNNCSGCEDMENRMCLGCDECTNCNREDQEHCSSCSSFDIDDCDGLNCNNCESRPCSRDSEGTYTHYDDQNGLEKLEDAHNKNGNTYIYAYTLINPKYIKTNCEEGVSNE